MSRKRPVPVVSFFSAMVVFVVLLFCLRDAAAFPDAEVLGTGDVDPPFDYSVNSTMTGFTLLSDSELAISYGQTVKLISLATFEPLEDQPVGPNTDDKTDGVIAGITYDSAGNLLFASQEDGDMLTWNLSKIADKPETLTIATGKKLGPLVFDPDSNYVYVSDITQGYVHVVDTASDTVKASVQLTGPLGVTIEITDGIYDDNTREIYFSSTCGYVYYFASGQTTVGNIVIDATGKTDLEGVAANPGGDYIYVVDYTNAQVVKISTSSHTIVNTGISISENPSPTDIVIPEVTNPSGNYAYVAGAHTPGGGVSIIDTGSDTVIDMGTDPDKNNEPLDVSAQPYFLAASSATDGYVYMGLSTGKTGVITANPWVSISSVTYSDGGTTLKLGQSMTITFRSNQDGTWTFKANGSVTGSGTVLKDDSGNTSGSIVKDTDTAVTIKQADNSDALKEGDNDIFAFVASSLGTGRMATVVNVDTPPPNVVIRSTNFGNERIYIVFDRIDEEDMSVYNVYIDTDPAAVLTKTDPTVAVAQASSGSTETAEVGGLVNGTLYYIAMEAKDVGGNLSSSRTNTFADGTVATATPEQTVGPAGLMGEKGCGLVPYESVILIQIPILICILILIPISILISIRIPRRSIVALIFISITVCLFLFPNPANAEEQEIIERSAPAVSTGGPSSQWWSVEIQSGFWLPHNKVMKDFFGNCCNITTKIEGGLLAHGRYGAQFGVGFMYQSGRAVGAGSGQPSGDKFSFITVPMELGFTWRADYFSWRYLIPYIKTGVDSVFYREGDVGGSTKGLKWGLHGAGGVGLNIGELGDVAGIMDNDFGINDLFLTLEARYQWINNFGGKGLDLSGWLYSAGFLISF